MGNLAYKQRHRELGLCTSCSRPAEFPYTLCFECRKKAYLYERTERRRASGPERRKRRAKQGKCTRCGAPLNEDADGGYRHCINCRQLRYHMEGL